MMKLKSTDRLEIESLFSSKIFFQISIRSFDPNAEPYFTKARRWVYGNALKLAASAGCGVVLIGSAGTGKTYLMEKICSGNIVNSKESIVGNQFKPPFIDVDDLPSGVFGIDEAHHTNPIDFFSVNSQYLLKRNFVVALPWFDCKEHRSVLNLYNGRRLIVVKLLGKFE